MPDDRHPSAPPVDLTLLGEQIRRLLAESAAVSADHRAAAALMRETIARVRRDRLAWLAVAEPPG